MSWDVEAFRQKLEDQHQFPGEYMFKFIVPHGKKDELLGLLPKDGKTTFRESSSKTYISITCKAKVQTSQVVLDVYIAANQVEGCIAL
ncbi:YbeD family protein [Marinoscillum furvescens]|uniref:DUF493 domain-containing protein n=1 Tax=Marinoscillum furvescens DSM 4134 TaxID=1122208 RepID=A0A3D9L2L5_MARFU|nr:DUF493 family protein [Marinoscillum furvescens]RED98855.1 hypothetical protein C7460_10947 [Marinoscillum furvescens DSM 4134]